MQAILIQQSPPAKSRSCWQTPYRPLEIPYWPCLATDWSNGSDMRGQNNKKRISHSRFKKQDVDQCVHLDSIMTNLSGRMDGLVLLC